MASDEDKKKERLLVEQAESLLSSFPKEPQIEDRLTLEALRYLNKAITLDPENDDAWNTEVCKNNIGDHTARWRIMIRPLSGAAE